MSPTTWQVESRRRPKHNLYLLDCNDETMTSAVQVEALAVELSLSIYLAI